MGNIEIRNIELREWYYDNDKQEDRARLLKTLKFRERYRDERYRDKRSISTIKDIKEFVLEESINSNEPVCTCFLEIWKFDHKENDETIITKCNYSDSTYLFDTIFSDKKILIKVCIKKERVCTCGKYPLIERISRLINEHKKEKLNWEKKNKEDCEEFNKKIQEQNEKYQNELNLLNESFNKQNEEKEKQIQNQIEEFHKEINRLKDIIKSKEEEKQINSEKEENEVNEENNESEENKNKDLEKSFSNQIFAVYKNYYKNNKDLISSDFVKEMNNFFKKISESEDKNIIYEISKNIINLENKKDII